MVQVFWVVQIPKFLKMTSATGFAFITFSLRDIEMQKNPEI